MTLTSRLRVPILVSLAVMLLGMVVALVKSGWFAPQASSPGHVETRPQPAAHRAPGHTQVETPANPPGHDGLKRKAFASPLPPYTVKLPPLGSMPSKVIYCPFCPSRYGKFDRLARIKQAGGTPDIDDAVLKALQHLKQTQRVDGSWSGGPAMTALAVLAYYGQGEGVISADIGDSCLDAIFSLVKLGKKNNGLFTNHPGDKTYAYDHAIVTYALAEAAVSCKEVAEVIPDLDEVSQKAGQYIIDHQHGSGGWDYGYARTGARGGDLSITTWQLLALKACAYTGLTFRGIKESANKSIPFVRSLQAEAGGFGYAKQPARAASDYYLTEAGVFCLQLCGSGCGPEALKGTKYINDYSHFDYNTERSDLSGRFFESQAMIYRGADEWKRYSTMTLRQLLDNQGPDGSWKASGGGKPRRALAPEYVNSVHYRTCLCALMLETYYGYLSTMYRPPREPAGFSDLNSPASR